MGDNVPPASSAWISAAAPGLWVPAGIGNLAPMEQRRRSRCARAGAGPWLALAAVWVWAACGVLPVDPVASSSGGAVSGGAVSGGAVSAEADGGPARVVVHGRLGGAWFNRSGVEVVAVDGRPVSAAWRTGVSLAPGVHTLRVRGEALVDTRGVTRVTAELLFEALPGAHYELSVGPVQEPPFLSVRLVDRVTHRIVATGVAVADGD